MAAYLSYFERSLIRFRDSSFLDRCYGDDALRDGIRTGRMTVSIRRQLGRIGEKCRVLGKIRQ
jgi:hypothetical protein